MPDRQWLSSKKAQKGAFCETYSYYCSLSNKVTLFQAKKQTLSFYGYICTAMTEFNRLQTIKRRLFAMRNGIIADTLRKAGSPYRIIFGVNLPQLSEIASEIGKDLELATVLWDNKSTRESRMIAPMIYPLEHLTAEKASEMFADTDSTEVMDILCHKLLRQTTFSSDLIAANINSPSPLHRYGALRLLWWTIAECPERALELAQNEFRRDCPMTKMVARQIIDEVEFIQGN